MGDNISELPVDNLPPTNDEKDMIRWMYADKKEEKKVQEPAPTNNIPSSVVNTPAPIKFHMEIKSLIIIIIFYIALSNSATDSLFHKFLPITAKSNIILLGIKSFIFGIVLLIFFNFYYRNTYI
jgi:uncharacterized integral membrane protein